MSLMLEIQSSVQALAGCAAEDRQPIPMPRVEGAGVAHVHRVGPAFADATQLVLELIEHEDLLARIGVDDRLQLVELRVVQMGDRAFRVEFEIRVQASGGELGELVDEYAGVDGAAMEPSSSMYWSRRNVSYASRVSLEGSRSHGR
ncbi:MAG: hypothetical protein ACLRL4_10465 [Bifidobacterium bifidum]